jgi:hypothetical protein
MRVWIGFIRGDAYVHEWTGEIAEESDIGQAIGNAVTAYTRSTGKPIWGTTDHGGQGLTGAYERAFAGHVVARLAAPVHDKLWP